MKHYTLLYTTRKDIMEKYGRKYGYSLLHMETFKIDTPLQMDASDSGIFSFLADDGGFRVYPVRIEVKQNALVLTTNNNIYLFEEL